MATFTPRQREVLKRRLALALCWDAALGYQQDANNRAETVIRAIEDSEFSAMAQRRAIAAIVARLEKVS